ncbi:hypothetical protein AQ490_07140 [Wenjunlia vitaminophila]|uniref:YibE/F family protein n=1 Tax=Wenjunlia vitaminophila TaxID=76728 RepID=A0A0T6LMB3_WENVI|nr:hypothetical protein AQ490_07140 [Wenjunlia vitaminophila]
MSGRLRKVIAAVLIPFGVAVLAGLVVLWPGGVPPHEHTGLGFDQHTERAKVVSIEGRSCAAVDAAPGQGEPREQPAPGTGGAGSGEQAADRCRLVTFEVTSGKDGGTTFTEVVRPDQSRQYHDGQGVVVAYAPQAPPELRYSVIDVQRGVPVLVLAVVFALVVVAVGRLRGLTALIALVISFGVLSQFILPAILQGSNPLLVAVVGGGAIMLAALYLCHGLSARTSVAVLGTLVSLLLIGLLGSLFVEWAALTGNTSDETGLVHALYPGIEIQGLLLASVIIGSLGVLDDVTVTQTSAVWELKAANPALTASALYRAGLRIGRDHIASTVNTLVLAYAGAALPMLLLFSVARSDVATVATSELVAEEIVRTLVGSIGLVASVPVTTALAALIASADPPAGGERAERAELAGVAGVGAGRGARRRGGGRRRRR